MDQQAFRQLLSTPRPSSSSAASPSAAGSSGRAFGLQNKRSQPSVSTSSSSSATAPSSLRPRKLAAQPKSTDAAQPKTNSLTGQVYQDRATARRSGKETEYADVEKLLADFEQRAAQLETEEERQALRDQIKFLGGDEKHTVLVKGLDFALLAQNKAKLEAENQGNGDEDLEQAFQSGKAAGSVGEDASTAEGDAQQQGETKRTRESIIEALKKRRLGQAAQQEATSTTATAQAALGNKFKPIGFRPIASAASHTSHEDPDVKYVNGKRMRKKKKKTELNDDGKEGQTGTAVGSVAANNAAAGAATAAAATASTSNVDPTEAGEMPPSPLPPLRTAVASRKSPLPSALASEADSPPLPASAASVHTGTARTPRASSPSSGRPEPEDPDGAASAPSTSRSAAIAPTAPSEDDDDGDIDIFTDVGGWTGLPGSDSDDDDHDQKPSSVAQPSPGDSTDRSRPPTSTSDHAPAVSASAPAPKRDYFSHSLNVSNPSTEEPTLSPVGPHRPTPTTAHDVETPASPFDEPASERQGRLQGFSTSALPSEISRALLEREREREEKRKSREEGWKKKRAEKRRKGAATGEVAEAKGPEGGEDEEEGRRKQKRQKGHAHRGEEAE